MFLGRRRLRKWTLRSREHVERFVRAVPTVDPANPPQSLVGLGDQLSTAADRFEGWLADDPPPAKEIATVWGSVVGIIAAMGETLQRFERMIPPERRAAVDEFHELAEPMERATEVLRTGWL